MKRVPTPELLDTDAGSPAEIAAALADLRLVNRWFGGIATHHKMIAHIAQRTGKSNLSLLDVAAGSGYVPHQAQAHLHQKGINLRVTLLDRARSHLTNGTNAVVADALALPFPDGAFDLVSSNLFAHHLCPEALRKFLSNALRASRIAVLINDLIRDPMHLALVYAGFPLYRSRLTRHDAPASVRQAYTVQEMRDLITQAGAARVEIHRHYLFRMGAIAWKHA
jgi:methyltransferase family protein